MNLGQVIMNKGQRNLFYTSLGRCVTSLPTPIWAVIIYILRVFSYYLNYKTVGSEVILPN